MNIRRSYLRGLLAGASSALVLTMLWSMATVARAENREKTTSYGPWVWGVSGGAVHQFDSDLDDSDANFSVSRYFTQLSFGYARDRSNSVSLSLGMGESRYDFSPAAGIGNRDPWDNIRDYRLSVPIRYSPSKRANIIVIPGVRSYVEEGASLNDGRTEGVIAAAGWKFSDTLTLGPGFGWFSELDGGSSFFPIVLVDWRITDRMRLSTGKGIAASQGPGLSLDYALAKNWTMGLTGRYEKTRFALDSHSATNRAIGEDRSVPLLLTIGYSPWPMTQVSAVAGVEFAGKLTLEDSSGRTLASSDFDKAAVMGLVFSSRF